MGDHRAERRGQSRRRSGPPTPEDVGRRRAEPLGRRRAAKAPGGRFFKGLPSAPIMIGVAALAISAGGAVTAGDPALMGSSSHDKGLSAASALNGTSASASTDLLNDRRAAVSRDSRRDALQDAADAELEAAMEKQAQQRDAALALLAQQAEKHASELAANRWVLPVDNVEITAEFGEYGLWASYHTGLDFNGNSGDPIYAVASGVVTSVGYDGAYGNKTVVTLEDGTEIWYAHQTSMLVSEGEVVRRGRRGDRLRRLHRQRHRLPPAPRGAPRRRRPGRPVRRHGRPRRQLLSRAASAGRLDGGRAASATEVRGREERVETRCETRPR